MFFCERDLGGHDRHECRDMGYGNPEPDGPLFEGWITDKQLRIVTTMMQNTRQGAKELLEKYGKEGTE